MASRPGEPRGMSKEMAKYEKEMAKREAQASRIKQPKKGAKSMTRKQMRRIAMKKGGKQILKRMIPGITAAEIAYLIATADKQAPQRQMKKRAKSGSFNIGRKM
jgi:hypothetical protein